MVLEFELRTSYFLGRCSITWATPPTLFYIGLYFIFLHYYGLNSGPAPWATPPALPFFCDGFFRGSQELFDWGWLWTMILIASWVSRITGMSHWPLTPQNSFKGYLLRPWTQSPAQDWKKKKKRKIIWWSAHLFFFFILSFDPHQKQFPSSSPNPYPASYHTFILLTFT
jgi:hypothetical protein